jgi:Reverse transcriptase (RNA-dependent DNA polymerase)
MEQDCLTTIFTPEKLRVTWKQLRKELRKCKSRDILDWLDWIATIDLSLAAISCSVIESRYQPKEPTRFEVAKAKGSFRELVMPNVVDALVYRHITDYLYNHSLQNELPTVFFSKLHTKRAVGEDFQLRSSDYETFYVVWKHYNEYKTRTLLNGIYKILVVTDISNYFDSISHQLLIEHLSPYIPSRKVTGLLLKILETLKPNLAHTVNPGIGIPVDDLECSRQLAHIFLYEHDQKVSSNFGIENYVRWMDDQSFGAEDKNRARKIVSFLTRSLSSQRLTLNAGKTKFLTPTEVAKEFHLETNDEITSWEGRWKEGYNYCFESGSLEQKNARQELISIYRTAKFKRRGNWGKVVKRLLGHTVALETAFFDRYLLEFLIEYPSDLAARIFETLAKRNQINKLIELFQNYSLQEESLYEDVEADFFYSLLFADVNKKNEQKIISLIKDFLCDALPNTGKPLGRSAAILCYYWFNDNLYDFFRLTEKWDFPVLSKEIARAIIAINSANPVAPDAVNATLLRFNSHISEDVGKLSQFIFAIRNGKPISFRSFANRKSRGANKGKFYDSRAWLGLEILSHSQVICNQHWYKKQLATQAEYAITRQEKRVLKRIRDRLEI